MHLRLLNETIQNRDPLAILKMLRTIIANPGVADEEQ